MARSDVSGTPASSPLNLRVRNCCKVSFWQQILCIAQHALRYPSSDDITHSTKWRLDCSDEHPLSLLFPSPWNLQHCWKGAAGLLVSWYCWGYRQYHPTRHSAPENPASGGPQGNTSTPLHSPPPLTFHSLSLHYNSCSHWMKNGTGVASHSTLLSDWRGLCFSCWGILGS